MSNRRCDASIKSLGFFEEDYLLRGGKTSEGLYRQMSSSNYNYGSESEEDTYVSHVYPAITSKYSTNSSISQASNANRSRGTSTTANTNTTTNGENIVSSDTPRNQQGSNQAKKGKKNSSRKRNEKYREAAYSQEQHILAEFCFDIQASQTTRIPTIVSSTSTDVSSSSDSASGAKGSIEYNPDSIIDWDMVNYVTHTYGISSSELSDATKNKASTALSWSPALTNLDLPSTASVLTCPICLDAFVAPVVPQCGHAICLPCHLSHAAYSDTIRVQCPVCSIPSSHKDLRPVVFRYFRIPQEGDSVSLSLLSREKGTPLSQLVFNPSQPLEFNLEKNLSTKLPSSSLGKHQKNKSGPNAGTKSSKSLSLNAPTFVPGKPSDAATLSATPVEDLLGIREASTTESIFRSINIPVIPSLVDQSSMDCAHGLSRLSQDSDMTGIFNSFLDQLDLREVEMSLEKMDYITTLQEKRDIEKAKVEAARGWSLKATTGVGLNGSSSPIITPSRSGWAKAVASSSNNLSSGLSSTPILTPIPASSFPSFPALNDSLHPAATQVVVTPTTLSVSDFDVSAEGELLYPTVFLQSARDIVLLWKQEWDARVRSLGPSQISTVALPTHASKKTSVKSAFGFNEDSANFASEQLDEEGVETNLNASDSSQSKAHRSKVVFKNYPSHGVPLSTVQQIEKKVVFVPGSINEQENNGESLTTDSSFSQQNNNLYLYYGSSDGSPVFFDPLTTHALQALYNHGGPVSIHSKSRSNSLPPQSVALPVLQVTPVIQSWESRKKYPFCSHLPLRTRFYILYADPSPVLSLAAEKLVGQRLSQRTRAVFETRQARDKMDKMLTKRKDKHIAHEWECEIRNAELSRMEFGSMRQTPVEFFEFPSLGETPNLTTSAKIEQKEAKATTSQNMKESAPSTQSNIWAKKWGTEARQNQFPQL